MADTRYKDGGNPKYTLGWDNEDISMTIKPGGEETKNVAIPTEKTCDPYKSQDNGSGKSWAKTLASRRGKSDAGDNFTPGGYGGPNAR